MNDQLTAAFARAYFDSRAHLWEAERQNYFTDAVRDDILRHAKFDRNARVIDYGSGSGYLTEALLRAGLHSIVAVDVSPNMLLELQQRHGNGIETRVATGSAIPLENASVDGLVCNMVLHHLEDPALFFAECARVLRPRGRAVVTDLVVYGAADFAADQNDRWTGFELDQVRGWITASGLLPDHLGMIGQRCCAQVSGAGGGAEIFLASAIRP